MIISASRRTDIPAFYGDWFINRLKAGYVCVRNPLSKKNITKIPLSPENVDCIVFWTKDPAPFLKKIDYLDREGYKYYFLFTINPYNVSFEKNVRDKDEIIRTFKKLSERIGINKVIWRYDPVIFTEEINPEYHKRHFEYFTDNLNGYTKRCIISFLDQYKKVKQNMSNIKIIDPDINIKNNIIEYFSETAFNRNIELFNCASGDDFLQYNVRKSMCIDDKLIEDITGYRIKTKKDSSQRKECLCIESRDIGAYNTCMHDCNYCYANVNKNTVIHNYKNYDPDSEVLCSSIMESDSVNEIKKYKSLKISGQQKELF